MTNIAICLFGRVGLPFGKWNKSTKDNTIYELIQLKLAYLHWKKHIIDANPNYNIDFFIHTWNINLENEFKELFNPKKYKFEEQIYDFNIHECIINNKIKYKKGRKKSIRISVISRLYSAEQSVILLKKYMKETNIEYKQVIVSRIDQAFRININFDELLDNNVKIISGLHLITKKANYNPKLVNHFNKIKLSNNYIKLLKKNLYINKHIESRYISKLKIIDHIIISNFRNILEISKLYSTLLPENIRCNTSNIKVYIDRLSSPHFCITDRIRISIVGMKKGKLKILTKYYFDNGEKNKLLDNRINIPLVRQLYFNTPGHLGKLGQMKGIPYGRLVDIKKFLKEHNIDEKIINMID